MTRGGGNLRHGSMRGRSTLVAPVRARRRGGVGGGERATGIDAKLTVPVGPSYQADRCVGGLLEVRDVPESGVLNLLTIVAGLSETFYQQVWRLLVFGDRPGPGSTIVDGQPVTLAESDRPLLVHARNLPAPRVGGVFCTTWHAGRRYRLAGPVMFVALVTVPSITMTSDRLHLRLRLG